MRHRMPLKSTPLSTPQRRGRTPNGTSSVRQDSQAQAQERHQLPSHLPRPWAVEGIRSGQRVSRTFSVKGDAEGWLNREQRRIERGDWDGPERPRKDEETAPVPTVAQWLDKIINERSQRASKPLGPAWKAKLEQYVRDLINPHLGRVPIDQLTRARVEHWRYLPEITKTPTSAGHAYDFLRSAMSDALERDLIDKNPCVLKGAGRPEREREPHPLTLDDFTQLLGKMVTAPEGVPPTERQRDDRMAVLLEAVCALRIGEVLALRHRDVDLMEGALHIRQAVTKYKNPDGTWTREIKPPKTPASRRTVHLPPGVVVELRAFLDGRPGGKDTLLFPGHIPGVPRDSDTLRRAFKRAAAAIERPDLRPHDLRSAGASWAAQSGASVREVQARLGHTTPTMALRYQPAEGERDRAVAARIIVRMNDESDNVPIDVAPKMATRRREDGTEDGKR